ncbi:hypothetical protein FQP90_13655 [Paenarthrobacter nitroguajacolicus]|uniref:DUF2213 domain-containing protein n=1 Tax=Paenarthrobacter nitroguajacolicus TaxID=211146 RepID=A0A558GXG9_PAENT|nr:hypothetical protein [Paenarthrobacter nitroguajacolicus]TVU61581.1 hypothetical protein FQP90_13655 [Paenarthrobacter nitroguajacolicus]
MAKLITEAGKLSAPSSTGKLMITLITPGWGSSGYYSDKVLEQAAKDKVFPEGTQMHIDHMSSSDEYERPAGSLTTLAAVLEEDAVWDPNYLDAETGKKGRLAAPALLGSKYRPEITEFAKYIGTSVAVGVDMKAGEAEGRRGQIVEAMYPHKLNRVDFVTVAGRGGKIDKVIEAFAIKAHEVTANDLRSQLRELVRGAYGDDHTYVWLEDHDDTNVWFSLQAEAKATTYQVGYTVADDVAALSGESTEVRKVTQYVPVTPAQESKDSAPNPAAVTENQEEATMATIDDAELKQLREAASRATALEAENTTLKTDNAKLEGDSRKSAAEAIVAEAFGDVEAKVTRASLVTAALAAETFDPAALKDTAVEAAAEIRAARGEGNVHGAGQTNAPGNAQEAVAMEVGDADILKALKGGN